MTSLNTGHESAPESPTAAPSNAPLVPLSERDKVRHQVDTVLGTTALTAMKDEYQSRISDHRFDWVRAGAILEKPENSELLATINAMKTPRVLRFDGQTLIVVEAAELSEADACTAEEVDARLAQKGPGARLMDGPLYQDFATHHPVDLGAYAGEEPGTIHGSWVSTFQGNVRKFGIRARSGATAHFDADLPGVEKRHFLRICVELR